MVDWLKQWTWVLPLLVTALGGIWALITFDHQSRMSFQKPMTDKTIEYCEKVSEDVGALVGARDISDWEKAHADFLTFYYGQLVLTEDQILASSMVEMKNKLKATPFEQRNDLEFEALHVSQACRRQIKCLMDNGWKLTLVDGIPSTTALTSDKILNEACK